MKFIAIIPSRFASTRFPGKALVQIEGKTMIQRVHDQVSKVLDEVYVATDDDRIADHVKEFGGKSVMTSYLHSTGTDRCNEAATIIEKSTGEKIDVIINVQGDEPFIQPSQLELLMECFENQHTDIATLVKKIETTDELDNPNQPKVILGNQQQAIYFSRATIPYLRNKERKDWLSYHTFYKHIGIYAYRHQVLKKITKLAPSPLEKAESLEQNRWIEHGYHIKVAETIHESIGIDTPEDLDKVHDLGLL